MPRIIIIELAPADERDFAEVLRLIDRDLLRDSTIHIATDDAAEKVLAPLTLDIHDITQKSEVSNG